MTQYFIIAQLLFLGFNFSLPKEEHEKASEIVFYEFQKLDEGITCRCKDSLTLVTFYQATDGPNWKEQWDLSKPLEEWFGVALDNGDCVSRITLNGNDLKGELPEEIGDLTYLKQIALGNNFLTGPIPFSLGDLSILESINFRNNQLTGMIPGDLGSLIRLHTLNLSVNELSGTIPSQIGNLQMLTGLFLNQNNLTGTIPILLGNLSELVSINLANNNLEGNVLQEIGNLVKLVGVGLNGNNFSGPLPERFGQLEKLVSLRLEDNNFTGNIPEAYGDLPRLETIFLSNNNLSGCYPESFEKLCSLLDNTSEFGRGYNFKNNPLLPWEGDFARFCNGENQLGASCDDGNPNTVIDGINEDCGCRRMVEIVEEPLQLSLTINTIGTCPDENLGTASITISPDDLTYQIDWLTPDGSLNSETTTAAVFSQENLAAGIYNLTITDVSENYPPRESTVEILHLNCFDTEQIPQLITPNGDGLNEQFIFEDLANNPNRFPDNELIIFNRWGNTIFRAKPYQNNWSGNNQAGTKLPDGTYYYVFRLDLNQGLIIKGDITIVR